MGKGIFSAILFLALTGLWSGCVKKKETARPPGIEMIIPNTPLEPGHTCVISLKGTEPSYLGSLTSMKIFMERDGLPDTLVSEWKKQSFDERHESFQLKYVFLPEATINTTYRFRGEVRNTDEEVSTVHGSVVLEVGRMYEPVNSFSLTLELNKMNCMGLRTQKVYKLDTAWHQAIDFIFFYEKGQNRCVLSNLAYPDLATESGINLSKWNLLEPRNSQIGWADPSFYYSDFKNIKNYSELALQRPYSIYQAIHFLQVGQIYGVETAENKIGLMYITSLTASKISFDIKMEK